MFLFFGPVSDFPDAHGAAVELGALLVQELGINGALPVPTLTFLFPLSPVLILSPESAAFFLRAKNARGQA